jgi:hypothetical protein
MLLKTLGIIALNVVFFVLKKFVYQLNKAIIAYVLFSNS